MKKNLRIVSAAAALLAVAPVAATAIATPATTSVAKAASNTATTNQPNVWLYTLTDGKYVSAQLNKQTLRLDKGTKLTINGTEVKNAPVYKVDGTTADGHADLIPVSYNGQNFFVAKKQVNVKEVSQTAITVDTTVNEPALLANRGLESSEVSRIRKVLNVSSDIYFDTKDAEVSFSGNNAVLTNVYLKTKLSPAKFLDSADAQALKKTFLNGESVNNFTVDSKGNILVNGKRLEITVDRTYAAAPTDSSSTKILNGTSIFNANANTTVTISAVAKHGSIPSAVNGGVSVTLDGKNYDALLHTNGHANNVEIFTANKAKHVAANDLTAGHYIAVIRRATVALDNKYAGTKQTFTLSRGVFGSNGSSTKQVTVGTDGVANLGEIQVPFYAYDATKLQGVNFYAVKTGQVVTSGNVTLHAVNGQLTVQSVYAALNAEYGASQYRGGIDNDPDVLKPVNDIKDQLKKANIKVSDNGYFTAPASFTINMHAKSNLNGAEATLPVTVNVDNAQASNNATETTKNVTIMHIATIYDKNGKATHEPALRAYDTYSVVATPVSLKDEKGKDAGMFYKLAGKDQYIKVGNVDGTKRSLKKNSYVYKSTGKAYMKSKKHHRVLKAGSSVTTYGKSFMIAGHQMYRIGKNQYVKKANF